MQGEPVPAHRGAIAACPRCGLPMTIAQEQLEHRGNPHSVTCTTWNGTAVVRGSRCGAHFVCADPEEPAQRSDLPPATLAYLGDDFNWPVFRRPIVWQGDVG